MGKFVSFNGLARFKGWLDIAFGQVDDALGTKQDTLVSGTNIKTLNNQSLLGEGNLEIQGGGIEEAPDDGNPYLRKNKSWIHYKAAVNETVVLHISADYGTLPLPIPVVVRDADTGTVLRVLSWAGSDLRFIVADDVRYTIEFGNVEGYKAPLPYTEIAIAGTQRNVDVVYYLFNTGVYIGYTDGTFSPYNELVPGKTVKGVVLKTDDISICIHKTEGAAQNWGPMKYLIEGGTIAYYSTGAKKDFAGKKNTDAIIAFGGAGTAFTFARNLGSEWYLPAAGEMEQIRLNRSNINTALGLIGGSIVDFINKGYWSSTQYENTYNYGFGAYYYLNGSGWLEAVEDANYASRAVCAF